MHINHYMNSDRHVSLKYNGSVGNLVTGWRFERARLSNLTWKDYYQMIKLRKSVAFDEWNKGTGFMAQSAGPTMTYVKSRGLRYSRKHPQNEVGTDQDWSEFEDPPDSSIHLDWSVRLRYKYITVGCTWLDKQKLRLLHK